MVLQYNCPNCSHELDFSPKTKTLSCKSCGYSAEIDEDKSNKSHLTELEFNGQEASKENFEEVLLVECTKCAGKFNLPQYTISIDCPYCGTNTIVDESNKVSSLKPSGLVPFVISTDKVKEMVKQKVGSNPFVPSTAKDFARTGKINGIYVPTYSFDFRIETDYNGQRGIRHTYTDKDGKSQTRVDWMPVSGEVTTIIDDLQFIKSRYADLLEIKESQNSSLVPYHTQYLSGFLAESHSHTVAECLEDAKKMTIDEVEHDIRKDIGGDEQRIGNYKSEYFNIYYRLFMYPLWIGDLGYKDKAYPFVISGADGSAQINVPISKGKVAVYLLIVTLFYFILLPFLKGMLMQPDAKTGETNPWGVLIATAIYFYLFAYALVKNYGVYSGVSRTGEQNLSEVEKKTFQKLSKVKDFVKNSTKNVQE